MNSFRNLALLSFTGGGVMAGSGRSIAQNSIASAPIELVGDWGRMITTSVLHVLERMRQCCCEGVRLTSSDQPQLIRVEEHTSGPPAVWLHKDQPNTAWIIVDVGERDWSRLAYQFGHELGHVLCNSWQWGAKPRPPTQWLEEALVEAFSLRGLNLLADSWSRDPPFKDDSGFGAAVAVYRQTIIERYGKLAIDQGDSMDPRSWFLNHQAKLESQPSLSEFAKVASLHILEKYEHDAHRIEALCALNRWPERSGIPLQNYFLAWEKSCEELNISIDLPQRLQDIYKAASKTPSNVVPRF
jgi:hypothetical protein